MQIAWQNDTFHNIWQFKYNVSDISDILPSNILISSSRSLLKTLLLEELMLIIYSQ